MRKGKFGDWHTERIGRHKTQGEEVHMPTEPEWRTYTPRNTGLPAKPETRRGTGKDSQPKREPALPTSVS